MKPILPALVAETERATAPATVQQAAVLLDGLLAFVDRYGLMRESAAGRARSEEEIAEAMDGLTQDYRAGLKHLPLDLLERAITATIQTYRNGFRPPLPAEVAATVEAEFIARADLGSKARLALRAA